MGLFWDLLQQSQIGEQRTRGESLQRRVAQLERELHETQTLVRDLIQRLEEKFGEDIDGDGRIG